MNATGRRAAVLVTAFALTVAAAVWWPAAEPPDAAAPTSVPMRAGASERALAWATQRQGDVATTAAAPGHDAVTELLQRGSLRGTELDGDWGQWAGQTLQPGRSLRRRFDHLLTGLGEVQPAQLRPWIAAQVAAQHGEAGAAQVLAVWDGYLALLQAGSVGRLDPSNEDAFRRAVAAQAAQRNAFLGPAWAHAFYADDDRDALALLARRTTRGDALARDPEADAIALALPPAKPLTAEQAAQRDAARIAAFGSEATQRLRAEDAAWAAWQQRLDDARQALRNLAANSSFATTTQRDQAMDAELTRRFEGTELVRARAMVGSP